MKKKILLSILVLIGVFIVTGCGNSNNNQVSNGKTYNVNGISINLDKDDNRDNIKYKTSSSFIRDYKTTMSTYSIYKDSTKNKYDLSNLTFRLDVNVDIMNIESTLEKEKSLVTKKDTFKNVLQNQKEINGTTWEFFSFDNVYDEENQFKEHLYITERKVDNYYYLYKVYFSRAENIDEFEEAFMDSIIFD